MTAAHSFSPSVISHIDNRLEESLQEKNMANHSVLIWPDCLLLQNLKFDDIPFVTDLVAKQSQRLHVDHVSELFRNLDRNGDSEVAVLEAKNIMVMVSCGNEEFHASVNKLRQLEAICDELADAEGIKENRAQFFMTADIRGHRNASKVMIFSDILQNGVWKACEDCFESLEGAQARQTLASHLKALK